VFGPVQESSSSLQCVLFGSRAFLVMRWTIPGLVLIEVASCGLFLAATYTHMGGEVDGLAYSPRSGLWTVAASRGDGAYL
jgi:hypothetical protein